MFIKTGWKYPVEVLCCSLSLGVLVWDRLAQVYPQIKQIFHGAKIFRSAMIGELEFTRERASERVRDRDRDFVYVFLFWLYNYVRLRATLLVYVYVCVRNTLNACVCVRACVRACMRAFAALTVLCVNKYVY